MIPAPLTLTLFCVASIAASAHCQVPVHAPKRAEDLEPPSLLRADGQPIDVTTGHAAPWVMDFDGDGRMDLLVGEFGSGRFPTDRLPPKLAERGSRFAEGKLRIYRNVGSNEEPRFSGFEYLRAGDADASVPTT